MNEALARQSTSQLRRYSILSLKIGFTLAALYLIITGADWSKILVYIQEMEWHYVLLALLLLNIGQVSSAFRLRYYFASADYYFRPLFAVYLYYIGMFFNRLLPSGIGGDGYNVYLLKRYKSISLLTSARLMISSRANGLLLLILIALVLVVFSHSATRIIYGKELAIGAMVLTLWCYSISVHVLLKESFKTQIGAAKFSLIVQGMVALSVYCLFASLNVGELMVDYIMLFMISTILFMAPISLGGAGVRELTFLYGGGLIGLDPELGVTVAVIYFLLDTISSLVGLIFWHQIDKIEAFETH